MNKNNKPDIYQENKKKSNIVEPSITYEMTNSFKNLGTKTTGHINTYHKGMLLWIDDKFIKNPLKKDKNTWEKIFGNLWDKTFKLMELDIETDITCDDGKKSIEKLTELQRQGNYVFCIIDLCLPKNYKDREFPSIDHGMELARLAKDEGLNCAFLTSQSKGDEEILGEMGVEDIPYFSKEHQNDIKFPDNLSLDILKRLRINVNWISIFAIYKGLDINNSHFDETFENNKFNLSIKNFPFFNVFKGFVEHWESPSSSEKIKRGTVIIFKGSKYLSDAFIQQCLLVTLAPLVQDYPDSVSFQYTRTANQRYRDYIYPTTPHGITINAIRIDTNKTKPTDFFNLLNEIPIYECVTYFILPYDKSSEPYLNREFISHPFIEEDLPHIDVEDTFLREKIIRNAVNLVLKEIEIITDEEENLTNRLGAIYLEYPEILFKPLTWLILLESSHVAEKLIDPFQVVHQIEKAASKLKNNQVSPDTRRKLANSEPIKISELFDFGVQLLEGNKRIDFKKIIQEVWKPKALKFWLSNSWKFPYGLDIYNIKTKHLVNKIPVKIKDMWEDFALEVLIDLIDEPLLEKNSEELSSVYDFLKHDLVGKVRRGDVKLIPDREWNNLLGVRWPHLAYPMPVSLSKKFVSAGRYPWVEIDRFNLSRVFPSTRLRYKHLVDVVDGIQQRLKWVESQCDHLPEEWSLYIRQFVDWLLNDSLGITSIEKVYYYLLGFCENILPLFYITYCILDGKFNDEVGIKKALNDLNEMKNPGILLGIIRSIRNKNMFSFIRPSKSWFLSSRHQSLELSNYYTHLRCDYFLRVQVDNFIKKLKSGDLVSRILKELSQDDKEKFLEILGVGELTPKICKAILDSKGLKWPQKREIFNFLKDTLPFKNLSTDNIEDNNPAKIVDQFFKKIMDFCCSKHREKQEFIFDEITNEISRLNTFFAPGFNPTESCKEFYKNEELSTLFSSPFDLFNLSLDTFESLSMALLRLNYVDGYQFLNCVRCLRNKGKEILPAGNITGHIEYIFELFCFGIEALIAQLKFLLEIAGETDLADRITLKYIESIKIPANVKIPPKKILKRFYEVKRKDESDRYFLYHLGILGTGSEGKKAIILDGKIDILNES